MAKGKTGKNAPPSKGEASSVSPSAPVPSVPSSAASSSSSNKNNSMNNKGGSGKERRLVEAFEDLEARFLLNLPKEELETSHRLFFQIEQAYWFYEDFLADESNGALPHFKSLEGFAEQMFKRCKLLRKHKAKAAKLASEFRAYMSRIPVFGVIILNEKLDKVLMCTPYKGKSWTWPKGKINQGEDEMVCAVREVYEEVGYNCGHLVKKDLYIEWTDRKTGKRTRLYVAPGAPETFAFKPRVRKEIGDIKWHPIKVLPTTNAPQKHGRKYYGVLPVIRKLIEIVAQLRAEAGLVAMEKEGEEDDDYEEGLSKENGDAANGSFSFANVDRSVWFPAPFRVNPAHIAAAMMPRTINR